MDAHIVLVEGGKWDYLGMKPWMHTLCVWKEEGSVITFV